MIIILKMYIFLYLSVLAGPCLLLYSSSSRGTVRNFLQSPFQFQFQFFVSLFFNNYLWCRFRFYVCLLEIGKELLHPPKVHFNYNFNFNSLFHRFFIIFCNCRFRLYVCLLELAVSHTPLSLSTNIYIYIYTGFFFHFITNFQVLSGFPFLRIELNWEMIGNHNIKKH